jgi:hypothetical protein
LPLQAQLRLFEVIARRRLHGKELSRNRVPVTRLHQEKTHCSFKQWEKLLPVTIAAKQEETNPFYGMHHAGDMQV